MMFTITFQGSAKDPTGRMLLHVAVMLHQIRIDPVALDWSASDTNPAFRTWRLVVPASPRVRELVSAVESSIGVTHVEIQPVPERPKQ